MVHIGNNEVAECLFSGVFDGANDIDGAAENYGALDGVDVGPDDGVDIGANEVVGTNEGADEGFDDLDDSKEGHPTPNSILETSLNSALLPPS